MSFIYRNIFAKMKQKQKVTGWSGAAKQAWLVKSAISDLLTLPRIYFQMTFFKKCSAHTPA